jgi:cell division protein FtsL
MDYKNVKEKDEINNNDKKKNIKWKYQFVYEMKYHLFFFIFGIIINFIINLNANLNIITIEFNSVPYFSYIFINSIFIKCVKLSIYSFPLLFLKYYKNIFLSYITLYTFIFCLLKITIEISVIINEYLLNTSQFSNLLVMIIFFSILFFISIILVIIWIYSYYKINIHIKNIENIEEESLITKEKYSTFENLNKYIININNNEINGNGNGNDIKNYEKLEEDNSNPNPNPNPSNQNNENILIKFIKLITKIIKIIFNLIVEIILLIFLLIISLFLFGFINILLYAYFRETSVSIIQMLFLPLFSLISIFLLYFSFNITFQKFKKKIFFNKTRKLLNMNTLDTIGIIKFLIKKYNLNNKFLYYKL